MNRIVYFLKRPGQAGRQTFALVKKTVYRDGSKPKQETVDNPALNALNIQVLDGMDLTVANLQADQILDAANKEVEQSRGTYVASEENQKLLKKYWKDVYEPKKIIDKKSAWCRLARAVDRLGPVSIIGAASDVQRRVDESCKDRPRRHRDVVAALSQLRGHLGCSGALHTYAIESPQFRYLTQDDSARIVGHVSSPVLRHLFTTLFCTGLRTGEAFALKAEYVRFTPKVVLVNVTGQIDREGARRETKTRKTRKTWCLDSGREALAAWLKLPLSEREVVCRNNLARIWEAACRAAFPLDSSKWTNVHDLRHSFAVHMLTVEGVSISIVAKLLGNSVTVCEAYYLNFVFEDDTLAALLGRK